MRREAIRRMTEEVAMLLDLAISRSRCSVHADEESKELVRGALESTKQEITHLEDLVEESEIEEDGRGTEAKGKGFYAS